MLTDPMSPRRDAQPLARIDDIEWLRAVAILFVLVQHSVNLLYWLPAYLGFLLHFDLGTGVDIFFAISGFVIARSLLPALAPDAGKPSTTAREIGAFWIARLFRLQPSAWLWLALVVLGAAFYNSAGAFGDIHHNIHFAIVAALQMADFYFPSAYQHREYTASLIYWSLSLEEQFYLLLPLLIVLLRKKLPWLLLAAILVQALIPRGIALTCVRTDALAWGVLLAWFNGSALFARCEPRFLASRRWLAGSLVVALLVAIPAIASLSFIGIGQRYAIVAVFAALLVWLGAYDRQYVSGHGHLSMTSSFKACMLWIGSRSYSIYLIHIPVFYCVRESWFRLYGMQGSGSFAQTLVFIGLSAFLIALLAQINYLFIEQPLRRYGKRLASRQRAG